MISVRLLSRDEYFPVLQYQWGCKLIDEGVTKDPYYGWTYWRAPWGFYFYVPEVGTERLCPEPRFAEILNELAALKP